MPTVAFLGPKGTFTHQAVLQQFGSESSILPQPSIGACFETLHKREADYAVVPFENSTNGQVVFTYDLLRDWFISPDGQKAQFHIVAEQFVTIHHYLYSNSEDLSKVDKLYSHPQVWGQVTEFLAQEKFCGQYSRIDTQSTAQAAEKVYKDETNTSACISSEMSGQLYNLPVKASEIEDLKGNTTRFLVLGYGAPLPSPKPDAQTSKAPFITSLMFVLNHNDPGALCSALDSFRVNEVNLTAIASRPSKIKPWNYVFFVEAEASSGSDSMKNSVELLKKSCLKVVELGSFERSWRQNCGNAA